MLVTKELNRGVWSRERFRLLVPVHSPVVFFPPSPSLSLSLLYYSSNEIEQYTTRITTWKASRYSWPIVSVARQKKPPWLPWSGCHPLFSISFLTRFTHASVEADPEALTDFVMMFVERENGRDELQKVFREELAVFCEDASSEYYEQRLF